MDETYIASLTDEILTTFLSKNFFTLALLEILNLG